MIRIFCGILCFALFLEAGEYIFSYRVALRDGLILNEKYNFSPVMVRSANFKKSSLSCEIPHNTQSEKDFLKQHKEDILQCFFSFGVRLSDESRVNNLHAKSLSFLEIPPSRVVVEFDRGIVRLYAKKKSRSSP